MDFGQSPPPRSADTRFYDKRGSRDLSSQNSRGEMPGALNSQRPIAIQPGSARGGPNYGPGFAAARSPPKAKSTSHVPCRFYPQGTCQAGAACQFSHDLDPTTQNAPCKYFARGSCKFGQSCALMHVLPDGRIINRPPRSAQNAYGRRATHGGAMYNGMRANPLAINTQEPPFGIPDQLAYQGQDPAMGYMGQPTSPLVRTEAHISNVSSPYGSPPNEYLNVAKPTPHSGLTARDAPLPSSWDSQGVSHAARNGPYAASVPGRFGLESPPASYSSNQLANATLREMQLATTFADTANLDSVLHGLGTSPRESEPLSFAKRPLHSERFARQRVPISSSLDVRMSHAFADDRDSQDAEGSDGQHSDAAGEDLLPSSLHDLLPIDKIRRPSKNGFGLDTADDSNSPWGKRVTSNGSAAAQQKGVSLSPQSASPSRYSAFFGSRMSSSTSISGLKANSNGDDSGHNTLQVGSPLRPSNLRSSSTPQQMAEGMSMLTSQLQRAKLDTGASKTPNVVALPLKQPVGPRSSSTGKPLIAVDSVQNDSANASQERIEEESEPMFSFDNDNDADASGGGGAGASAGDDYDGGMSALAGSQVMGASQTLGGSVAEPRSSLSPAHASSSAAAPGGNGFGSTPWAAVAAAGVIGGGRGK